MSELIRVVHDNSRITWRGQLAQNMTIIIPTDQAKPYPLHHTQDGELNIRASPSDGGIRTHQAESCAAGKATHRIFHTPEGRRRDR